MNDRRAQERLRAKEKYAMKQLLTAAAVASGGVSPFLVTPTDAIVVGALLWTAAVGAALIGNAILGDARVAGQSAR
jgi:hypothetical protein